MTRLALPLLCLTLASCSGGNGKAEQSADQLEKAAAQSDPTSAAVLENAADDIRETGDTNRLADPDAAAQQALERAAAINPTGVGSEVNTGADQTAPPPKQAVANRDGQRLNFDEKGRLQPRPSAVPPNARQ